ncbi:MAG TPA: helix-hairpin-helix domain-containing protein [Streptosporangiaceae bacterium]
MRKSRDPEPGSPQPAADDMQKIAGIGPALATRLAEAGVSRYRDLASFTQERLGAVVHVSPERIAGQDWIGQARRLASDVPIDPEGHQTDPEGHQTYATFHVELLIDADNTVRRTKARHYQTDAEDSWPGWDEQHLIAVIRSKAALDTPAARPTEPQAPEASPIHVDGPGPAEKGTHGTFRLAGQPTTVRMALQVAPFDRADAGPVDFIAEVAARSVSDNARYPVATASGVATIDEAICLNLGGQPLPPGLYRLEAEVTIYGHRHEPYDRPLCRHRSLGDLVHVTAHRAQQVPPAAGAMHTSLTHSVK